MVRYNDTTKVLEVRPQQDAFLVEIEIDQARQRQAMVRRRLHKEIKA